MPDWFYRTVTRPLLFRLSPVRARSLALGFIGKLCRFPGGGRVIDFLGHMQPDARLHLEKCGMTFRSSLGLGPYLDRQLKALPALARFGFGWLNLGPVSVIASPDEDHLVRQVEEEAILFSAPESNAGVHALLPRIIEAGRLNVPLMASLAVVQPWDVSHATAQCQQLIETLSGHVHCFGLRTYSVALQEQWTQEQWSGHLQELLSSIRKQAHPRPLLLCLPIDTDLAAAKPYIQMTIERGLSGIHLDGIQRTDAGWKAGKPLREQALTMVKSLRELIGPQPLLIAGGGVHEPLDALLLKQQGADLIEADTGLVFTGPGLPKRINEALLFFECQSHPVTVQPGRPVELTWFWTLLMGVGMLAGSILALLFSATTVILPYDESFLGMTRQQLKNINPNLLHFMAHDRTTLAGAMTAIGILYAGLSWYGIRSGLHWAKVAVFLSAITGFLSFFLFLGFGYLDPLHAFVTVVLLQFLLLGVIGKSAAPMPATPPDLLTDLPWKQSLWGQLLLILHAGGLMLAGVVISIIGVTQVFVVEDLLFMQTTADALRTADPKLIPLIAHDRATLGGMLLASGWVFLLPVLWGYRRSQAWLWWIMMGAGVAAYLAAIAIHYLVGYTHLSHLLPAFAGCALFLTGMVLSFPYLGLRHDEHERRWKTLLTHIDNGNLHNHQDRELPKR